MTCEGLKTVRSVFLGLKYLRKCKKSFVFPSKSPAFWDVYLTGCLVNNLRKIALNLPRDLAMIPTVVYYRKAQTLAHHYFRYTTY